MYECKQSASIRCCSTVNTMGNFLGSSVLSEPKNSPTSVDMIKGYINSFVNMEEPSSEAALCWHANIDDVKNVDDSGAWMMSLLPDEKQKVKRFKFADDQKRALLSILLQRAIVRMYFSVNDAEYDLIRSREVSLVLLLPLAAFVGLTKLLLCVRHCRANPSRVRATKMLGLVRGISTSLTTESSLELWRTLTCW
jgi:hypothetical protein